MTRLRIAICDDYERAAFMAADWTYIRNHAEVVSFYRPFSNIQETINILADFDAVCLMRERLPFPATLIDALPRLKFIVFTAARNTAVDHEAAARRGIPVSCTSSGPSKISTAELTWALILAAIKNIVQADTNTRLGYWRHSSDESIYPLPINLVDKRLGIVGLGQIGSRVALIGRAFGMEVIAWSQNLDSEYAAKLGVRCVTKEELFETSVVVSLHLVLSDRTRGIIGANDLNRMRSDSVLINTARADLLDQQALINALASQRPRAVALDVFDIEPLPLNNPILTTSNTIITPHLGYVNLETFKVFYQGVVDALTAWLDGKPIKLVNTPKT